MERTPLNYALELEIRFKNIHNIDKVKSEDFLHNTAEAIKESLVYLQATGHLNKEEVSHWSEEFDFGEGGLSEILENSFYVEKLNDLLSLLKCLL